MVYVYVCRESMDECRSSTLDDVMRAVTMENIPFDFGAFLDMSPEGLQLLKGLLQRDPAKRITAKEALKHPWFKLHAAYEETSKENGLQVGVQLVSSLTRIPMQSHAFMPLCPMP